MKDARESDPAQCSGHSVWEACLLPKSSVTWTGHSQKHRNVVQSPSMAELEDPNFLIFNTVLSSKHHSRIHLAFSFCGLSPSSQSGRWVMPTGCTVLNRIQRNSSPKLGQHTKPASYATAALNACPLPDDAREKGPYWVFQQLVPHLGTAQEHGVCTPGR